MSKNVFVGRIASALILAIFLNLILLSSGTDAVAEEDILSELSIVNEGVNEINNIQTGVTDQSIPTELMPTSEFEQQTHKEVFGYYAPYDTAGYESLTQNSSYMDNLLSATFDITSTGDVVGNNPTNVLEFSSQNGIKTYAVFQNREQGGFSPQIAETVVSSETLRQTLIQNIYSIVSANGYEGVNIDFEGLSSSYKESFTQFILELADVLRPSGYKIIVSIYPITSISEENSMVYDLVQLGNLVDYVQVMAHNQHGPWGLPGPLAGYQWVENVLQYTLSKITSEKILLGLTNYSYDWNLEKPSRNVLLPLKKILWLSSVSGGFHTWDPASQSPYFTYEGSNGNDHNVWYENSASIQLKTQLVLKYNLAGVSVWRLGYEETEFWNAVMAGLDSNNHIEPNMSPMLGYQNLELLDNHEMNDDFPDAVTVVTGGTYDSYISISDDKDFYEFTSQQGGRLTVNLTSPAGKDFNVEVYETADWSKWLAGSTNGAGQEDTMTFTVKPNTAYYIVVYGASATEFGPDP
ncbi:Spore germination protein YaaH, partial [Fontibacillus panacisegetis]